MTTTEPRSAWLGVAYERFSTDNQSSTKEQMAVNEEIAEEAGGRIEQHFSDEGIPRSLADRPGLLQMFDYVEQHEEIKYVVVNELERLTAGISQRAKVTSMCKRLGITLLTEDMGMIDPHDDDKMHEADQRAIASQGEVLKIRRRTRRALRQKARSGVSIMRPPYGTQMPGGGTIEIHPDEHPWLVQIFEWAADGVSLGEIRRRLDAAQVPTKSGKAHWSTPTLRGILDNPFYKGEMTWGRRRTLRDEDGRTYRDERMPGDAEIVVRESPLGQLVDPTTWARVQQVKEAQLGVVRARQTRNPRVLDNRVFCARCGYKMYSRDNGRRGTGETQWQYTCHTPSRPSRKPLPEFGNHLCRSPHSVSLKRVLATLAGASDTGGLELDQLVSRGSQGNADRRRTRLETEILDAQKRKTNAQQLGVMGAIPVDMVVRTNATEDAVIMEKQAALAELDRTHVDVVMMSTAQLEVMRDVGARLQDDTVPVADRMALLDAIGLDRIYVDKPNMRLHFRA